MSGNTRMSVIANCFLMGREGPDQEPLFSGGGAVCVNLVGYAIIPMEHYQHLCLLADERAQQIAGDALIKARRA